MPARLASFTSFGSQNQIVNLLYHHVSQIIVLCKVGAINPTKQMKKLKPSEDINLTK